MLQAAYLSTGPAGATRNAPLAEGWLDVGDGHRIWYGVSGAASGIPVLLLHGGPGSASSARQRDFHDPARYRIVQFDQRGCGRSTPLGATTHNHTEALLADIEALRRHLQIPRWLVAGGSWGATLALLHAARHPGTVAGLLLRGTFLATRADLEWFFHGAAAPGSVAHAQFMAELPRPAREQPWTWLGECFSGNDGPVQQRVAAAWHHYEIWLDDPRAPWSPPATAEAWRQLLARYRVQSHYLARQCFIDDDAVLHAASQLDGMPVALVHGTRDIICRPENSLAVHQACPGSRLAWAEGASHHPWHPETARLLRAASLAFAERGDFSTWPPAAKLP